jgi:hypothetical protein
LISSHEVLSVIDNMKFYGESVSWARAVQAVWENPTGLEARIQFCLSYPCGGIANQPNERVLHADWCSSQGSECSDVRKRTKVTIVSSDDDDCECDCSECSATGHSECGCCQQQMYDPFGHDWSSHDASDSYDSDYESARRRALHREIGRVPLRRSTIQPHSSVESAVVLAKHFVLSIFHKTSSPVAPTRPLQECPYAGSINFNGRPEGRGT